MSLRAAEHSRQANTQGIEGMVETQNLYPLEAINPATMIHVKQGKQPRKGRVPLRLLTLAQLIKKAQQGSDAARRELDRRLKPKCGWSKFQSQHK